MIKVGGWGRGGGVGKKAVIMAKWTEEEREFVEGIKRDAWKSVL